MDRIIVSPEEQERIKVGVSQPDRVRQPARVEMESETKGRVVLSSPTEEPAQPPEQQPKRDDWMPFNGVVPSDPPKEDEVDRTVIRRHPADLSYLEGVEVIEDKPDNRTVAERWRDTRSEFVSSWKGGNLEGMLMSFTNMLKDDNVGGAVKIAELVSLPFTELMAAVPAAGMGLVAGVADLISADWAQDLSADLRRLEAGRMEERARSVQQAFIDGNSKEAVYRAATGAVADVYANLKQFSAIYKLATAGRGAIVAREAGWKAVASNQAGRAMFSFMYAYTRTPGDHRERLMAGGLGMAYMMTPVGSSAMRTNIGAVGVDVIMNAVITAGFDPSDKRFTPLFTIEDGKIVPGGQYIQIREDAKAQAESLGMPELEEKFFWVGALPLLGSDIMYGLFTRSARSNANQTQAVMIDVRPTKMTPAVQKYYDGLTKKAVSMGLDPDLASTRSSATLNKILDGSLDVDSLNRIWRSESVFLGKKQAFDNTPAPELIRMDSRPAPRVEDVERRIGVGGEVAGAAERIASRPEAVRGDDVRALIDAMPDRENVVAALTRLSDNPATEPYVRAMYDAVRGAEETRPSAQPSTPIEQRIDAFTDRMVEKYGDGWLKDELDWAVARQMGDKQAQAAIESRVSREDLAESARLQQESDAGVIRDFNNAQSRIQKAAESVVGKDVADIVLREYQLEAGRDVAGAVVSRENLQSNIESGKNREMAIRRVAGYMAEKRGSDVDGLMSERSALTDLGKREFLTEVTSLVKKAEEAIARSFIGTDPSRTLGDAAVERTESATQRPTRAEMVDRIAESWEPSREAWTPERIAAIEDVLPETARVQAKIDFESAHPSEAAFVRNLKSIEDTLALTRSLEYGIKGKPFSEGNSLMRGVNLGLTALRADPEFNHFNFAARLDQMVKSPKDGGLKGFGESSRDVLLAAWRTSSPEEALGAINSLRISQGKVPFQDTDRLLGTDPQPAYRLNEEERAIGMQAMGRGIPDAVKATILDAQDKPLPRDPEMLDAWAAAASRLARQHNARLKDMGDGSKQKDTARWHTHTRLAQSSRYFFANIAADTGDRKIFDSSYKMDVNARRAGLAVDMRIESIAKGPDGARNDSKTTRWISSNPEVERAMVAVLGINPRTNNKQEMAQLIEASNTLKALEQSDPTRHKKVMGQIEAIQGELRGSSAINVRYLQTDKFRSVWDSRMDGQNVTVAQAYADARASGNPELLGRVMQKIEPALPMRFDPEKETGAKVPVETMIEALQQFNRLGKNDFKVWLADQEWGTRKHYWMSERDFTREISPSGVVEMFATDLTGATIAGASRSSVINTRTGKVDLEQGSLYAVLYRHMHRLETQVATIEQYRDLQGRLMSAKDKGLISDSAIRHAEDWMQRLYGVSKPLSPGASAIVKANSLYWSVYPLAIGRIAWHAARNLLYQGVPWGVMLTQFKAGDVATAYGDSLRSMRDPTSFTRRWLDNEFRSDVSQKRVYFNELMLMRDPSMRHYAAIEGRGGAKGGAVAGGVLGAGMGGVAGPAGVAVGAAAGTAAGAAMGRVWSNVRPAMEKWAEWSLSAPDEWNRSTVGATSFTIAERYLSRYLAGEIGYRGLEDGLMLRNIHPTQRMELVELFDQATRQGGDKNAYYDWMARVAEIKNENANFLYRVGGKSMLEQDPLMRQLIGLTTYPRGTVEIFYQNGVKPIAKNMSLFFSKDYKDVDAMEFRQGWRVAGMQAAAMTISGAVADAIIGRKQEDAGIYDMFGSMVTDPASPGLSFINSTWTGGKEIWDYIFTEADLAGAGKKFSDFAWRNAMFWLPALADVSNILEASNNIEGRRRQDALLYVINEDLARWDEVGRDRATQVAKHITFGTVVTEEEEKTIVDRLLENNLLLRILFGEED